jgi:hypothetical protein
MLFDSFDLNPVEGVTASNQRTHKQIGARADTTMSMFNVFCREGAVTLISAGSRHHKNLLRYG